MKKLQILLLLVFGLTFMTSCGDDIDCTDEAAVEAEVDPFFEAADAAVDAYNADNSEDNCKALKDAIKDYIDVLEKYEECVSTEDRADFDDVLSTLMTQRDELGC
jgi:hypothetical protein